jgi:hypothetical protein
VIILLCALVFTFSLQAKLELYGDGLRDIVHPCNSLKLCLDAHTPKKLKVSRVALARLPVSSDDQPTLHSEPVVQDTFFVPVPRELNLPYTIRLHRSPPVA